MQKFTLGDVLANKNKTHIGRVVGINIRELKDQESKPYVEISYTIKSHGYTSTIDESELTKLVEVK